jgi:HAT1-interacting factor 1
MSVEKGIDDQSESMLEGILGQIIGQSDSDKQSLLDSATKNATDLSAFVKRKPAASKPSTSAAAAAKRSALEEGNEGDPKRARVNDVDESLHD